MEHRCSTSQVFKIRKWREAIRSVSDSPAVLPDWSPQSPVASHGGRSSTWRAHLWTLLTGWMASADVKRASDAESTVSLSPHR